MTSPVGGIECPYITDGLVFWLDGIEKGAYQGSWTDLKGGVVFTNHGAQFGSDHVLFSNGAYLQNFSSGAIGSIADGATIEVAFIRDNLNGSQILFMQNFSDGELPVFGTSGNTVVFSTKVRPSPDIGAELTVCASLNIYTKIVNGTQPGMGITDNWGVRPNYGTVIGCRQPSSNNFNGKIYAIRIYNRSLSAEEMIFNQRIDNARFNLGLSI